MTPATFCHICERERDEWALDEDLYVALSNGLIVPACESCWQLWPHDHKATWPAFGLGRVPEEPLPAGSYVRLVERPGGGFQFVVETERRAA
jgi:hypothetical protein